MKAPVLHRRRLALPTLAAALLVIGGLTGGAAPAAAETCANEASRVEQNAVGLPDCRAYELVTPGAPIGQDSRPARAALNGGAITYYTNHPAPGAASSAFFYLARRGTEGWSYDAVGPQNEAGGLFVGVCEQNVFFSPDLAANILEAGWFDANEPVRCKRPDEIVPGEPSPYRNVFTRAVADDSHQLVNVTPEGVTPANARFHDASDDLSHVVFSEEAKLTPEAPAGQAFYLWNEGVVRLLTVLPNGSPASGEMVEAAARQNVTRSGFAPLTGAMSSDGRRVLFYSGGSLYLRKNADQPQSAIAAGQCTEPSRACTVRVDASQGPGASGGGIFWRATDSGSVVYFTATSKLTADSTAASGKPDLYRYDVESGQLTDLTVNAAHPADVRGVSGIGGEGSYLYFVANGVLAPGATPGNCPGTSAAPGSCNLYVLHAGSIAFIGRITRLDQLVWQEGSSAISQTQKAASLWANSSPSGRYFAFMSFEKLTGYDNTDLNKNTPDRQIFLYDAAANGGAGQLSCASCPPGRPVTTNLTLAAAGNYGPTVASNASWMTDAVLDDGSVFFNTDDAILPQDTNGSEDAYRYRGGEHHLLSPGDTPVNAHFLAVSRNGLDVFFRTSQSLVGRDRDHDNINIYTARIGGGFPEPPPPPPLCEGVGCRLSVEPPPAPLLPGTAVVTGTKPKPKCRRPGHRRRCRKQATARRGKNAHKPRKHRKVSK